MRIALAIFFCVILGVTTAYHVTEETEKGEDDLLQLEKTAYDDPDKMAQKMHDISVSIYENYFAFVSSQITKKLRWVSRIKFKYMIVEIYVKSASDVVGHPTNRFGLIFVRKVFLKGYYKSVVRN